jgi:uncharacterized protein YbaR (Trm112 family)
MKTEIDYMECKKKLKVEDIINKYEICKGEKDFLEYYPFNLSVNINGDKYTSSITLTKDALIESHIKQALKSIVNLYNSIHEKKLIQKLLIEKRIRLHYGINDSIPVMITLPKEINITIEELEILKKIDKQTFTDLGMHK